MRSTFIPLWLLVAAAGAAAETGPACPLPAVNACPAIGGYLDFNCDGVLKIAALGDSIVSGRGDTENGERGGYVLRLQQALTKKKLAAQILGAGFPGIGTGDLIARMKQEQAGARRKPITKALRDADLVVIDIGRNDWWLDAAPSLVARNVKRIARLAEQMGGVPGMPPVVVIAKLIPNERLDRRNNVTQQAYVGYVNAALTRLNQARYPVAVPFDRMPPFGSLQDPPRPDAGVHPTSAGYQMLTGLLLEFLQTNAQELMETRRPDEDKDNVFNLCETRTFRTNPLNPDSDGDTYSDGEEVYILFSDPKDPTSPGGRS